MRIFIKSFNPDRPLRTIDQCAAGLVAGLTVSFVATPIELLKAKLQVQYNAKSSAEGRLYSGPVDLARKLVKNHGVFALYQGLIFSNHLKDRGYSDTMTAFIAGGASANVFWTISYPCDVIKNRIMAQPDYKTSPSTAAMGWKYSGVTSCAKFIYKSEGMKGFYRGFAPCFLRSFPMNGAAILMFETVSSTGKKLFKQ
ncbi:UNVERIFIED_CONTAM: hypothetical protein HDU68_005112 [Siphonaria sp. JEL0065]|nr:hypothetical protein HDU68_005112 [Siphonaria sp. JEL0065]